MAYDEDLARRLRAEFAKLDGSSERKMFGGLCLMVDGKMCCGIVGGDLMVRVGPEAFEAALARPHVRPMDFTGRPMRGFVYVAPAGYAGRALAGWVRQAISYARTAPASRRPKRQR